MPEGSCFCGNIRISYTGEPTIKALCHCLDCRKITGSVYSTNIIVPEAGFTVTGTPKTIAKTGDTGNTITSHFCPDCGSTLFRDGSSFPGSKIVKAGVLDDIEEAKPLAELYVKHRVSWVDPVEGTAQKETMS
ncbi:hypothetical protein MKZ38_005736 [Zalerion maritima]|uniref:CENP-V/GFA domain-containing protein n=1 Tax=Zalerion maritima TaxID=339359 RepID=A0AAD5RJP8_9PEZI|nr:hypothetical protein MKZ38_005736 [Zalerion maritima]